MNDEEETYTELMATMPQNDRIESKIMENTKVSVPTVAPWNHDPQPPPSNSSFGDLGVESPAVRPPGGQANRTARRSTECKNR